METRLTAGASDTERSRYEHKQIGTVMIAGLGIGMGVAGIGFVVTGNWVALVCGLALLVALLLFHSLTVVVEGDWVEVVFADGPVRKRIALKEVGSCAVVRNRWWYGWGVRWGPGAWLYNVSGLDAVELKMKNGRRYRIGTDEPRELAKAIEEARARAT